VLGGKNWLFSDSVRGVKASANLYSLIETAKANRLEPYAYLRYLFTELPTAQTEVSFVASQPRVRVACTVARIRKNRGIEAALQGPLGMADIETTGASLRSRGGMRPLQARRHVLGAGNAPCRDKELRQRMPCVTFSASPRTVTHAAQRCALAQRVSSAGGRTWQDGRSDAAAALGGGSERTDGRQRPNDESKNHSPDGPRGSSWS
jgi:hypothetical protein